jgi:hypothetical protein
MKRREFILVVLDRLSIPLAGLLIAWVLLSTEFNAIGALLIIAVGALVAAPVSVYRHPAMHAIALALGICFVIGGVISGGVAAIGYWGESRDIGPSIFPLRIAVPIVSSLFIAAAIIFVKRWRGSLLLDVRKR